MAVAREPDPQTSAAARPPARRPAAPAPARKRAAAPPARRSQPPARSTPRTTTSGSVKPATLSTEQRRNAAIIIQVGQQMGMSTRDIQTALMTSLVESNLVNVNYGDRDSLGLFQQRPSQGWGTPAQVTNPQYAATQFYNHLRRVTNRGSMTMGQAAQAVQRSAFPDRYDQRTQQAAGVMTALGLQPGQATGGHLVPLSSPIPRTGETTTTGSADSIVPTSIVEQHDPADYGYVDAFLQAHPDVKRYVDMAADQGWTQQHLEAMVRTTQWWRTRTDAQRQYDVLQASDPKELEAKVFEKFKAMRTAANNLGITIGTTDLQTMARQAVQNGWSDAEITLNLARRFNLPLAHGQVGTAVGDAGTTITALGALATSYGVPLSNGDLQNYTRQVLGGQMTVPGLEDHFRDQAKILYPSISSALERGLTTQQIAAPYLTIAQRELGITDQQLNLADTKWTVPFDDGTGKQMTADQWTRTLRQDPRYGWDRTDNARTLAAQSVLQLGQMFGNVG